jgi:hypothetical protein
MKAENDVILGGQASWTKIGITLGQADFTGHITTKK